MLKKQKFCIFLALETKNEAQYWGPLIFLKFQLILDQKIMGGTRHPGCPPPLEKRPLAHGLLAVRTLVVYIIVHVKRIA